VRQSYEAGAADVACVLFVGSDATFLLDFECGDRAAMAGEVEKACWEGRRFDRERKALPDGRKGINFVAIMENSALHRKLKLWSVVERSNKARKLHPMTPSKKCAEDRRSIPRVWASLSNQRPESGFRYHNSQNYARPCSENVENACTFEKEDSVVTPSITATISMDDTYRALPSFQTEHPQFPSKSKCSPVLPDLAVLICYYVMKLSYCLTGPTGDRARR
jgi:hypothetical protein